MINEDLSELAKQKALPLLNQLQSYDDNVDTQLVVDAVAFAIKHHGTQKRHSGDPYYHHPLAVSHILADMKMDSSTLITGLLHDVVEDTEVTLQDIKENFGQDIANLVDGVTKLTKIKFKSNDEKQAENFRKFLIAISKDIRVLIVKLADRLHNMQTLHYIKKESKRRRISQETLEIYAPLAERIGMRTIKTELQDIAFQEINPDGYKSITERLKQLHNNDDKRIARTITSLKKILGENDIKAEISGREKEPYSIWSKMQSKNINFEQLSDIMALRIIVDSKSQCYKVLGVLHCSYHMIHDRFKDFISTPKDNGYQSIHTVIMGPEQQRIEVQIRTTEMHEIAELGLAAHWSYKQGASQNGTSPDLEIRQYSWLQQLLSIVENFSEPAEMLKNTKLEMYHDQVFCFTPKGNLIALPQNSTPVDFAFAVHSDIGLRCAGAKINGRIMPLRTRIKNGDQVEIIQSKTPTAIASWENFVVTGRALSEVKKAVRQNNRKEDLKTGKKLLEQSFNELDKKLTDKMLENYLEQLGKKHIEDVYIAIAHGSLKRDDILNVIFPNIVEKKTKTFLDKIWKSPRKKKGARKGKKSIPITGVKSDISLYFPECCYPLPHEKIIGIVGHAKGVSVHRSSCKKLEEYVSKPELWINITWDNNGDIDNFFVTKLEAVIQHKPGSLAEIAKVIADGKSNINNLNITEKSSDFFKMSVEIEVKDIEHMTDIIRRIRKVPCVNSVKRFKQD